MMTCGKSGFNRRESIYFSGQVVFISDDYHIMCADPAGACTRGGTENINIQQNISRETTPISTTDPNLHIRLVGL